MTDPPRAPSPPRFARALARILAPAADRSFLIDDLDEEYRERCARGPERAARRWYRAQVRGSALPLLRRRLTLFVSNARGARSMTLDSLVQDVRFALRSFVRRPGFTAVAVATIGLGVGANTAIFSLVNGALLGAVPGMGDTEGLVEISRIVDGDIHDVPYPVYREIAERSSGLRALAAFDLEPVSVRASGDPVTTLSLSVTASYFDVLGIEPGQGRFFAPAEATPPASAPVVVISEPFWRTRLGAMPDVVGSTVRVNGTPLTVVGVGPAGFRGHQRVPMDVFLPLGSGIPGLGSAEALGQVQRGAVALLGRLAPGASRETVAASANELGEGVVRAEAGAGGDAFRARVDPWGPIDAEGRGPLSAFMLVLMIVVGVVLVVACVNVAGMLLSRATEREGEMALRRALGAGSGRLTRQLLTESLLLFLGGGALGIVIALGLTRVLLRFEPPLPPGFEIPLDLGVDGRVLAFALALTTATAVVFNLVPALSAARRGIARDIAAGARGGARVRTRARSLLIAGQAAGSLTLLVTGGLFLRSLVASRSLDPGWDARDVVTADLDLALLGLSEDEGRATWSALLERARALPGVQAAALAARLPLGGGTSLGAVNVPGVEPPPGAVGFEAGVNRVSPGYFATLGVELLDGRPFGARDVRGGAPVAVVDERMAELLWPGRSAVGERFWLGPVGAERGFTVIGVAENTAGRRPGAAPEPSYYLPAEQAYDAHMAMLVRTAPGAGFGAARALRDAIREARPDLPVARVLPLEERLAMFLLPQRLAAWITGAVGLLGLALASVGIYGLTAYAVGRRTREIGVRLALGARPAEVRAGVVWQGLKAPLAGMLAGLALAYLVARAAAGFLVGIRPTDPWAYAAAVGALACAALLAAWLPATRAARTDPAGALRAD